MSTGSLMQTCPAEAHNAEAASVYVAPSVASALDALSEYGVAKAAFAGATCIMGSPMRHEPPIAQYVGIGRITGVRAGPSRSKRQ